MKPAIEGGQPVRQERLYYGHQYLDERDKAAVMEVLDSDYLTCGPKIGELEQKLCEITGAAYGVVCSNGTAALHAAVTAAGLGAGDEFITTPITFAASANCGLYVGARPVFADINPYTYNIDPDRVEALITPSTKAVVAVDYTGQPVELDRLREICTTHNLTLIEDGAHSIGSCYKGTPVGSIADMTTFSFHPVKTVTAGEGGAIMTNDAKLYQRLKLFTTHGITRDENIMETESHGPWFYSEISLGWNYRMTDIQAALLISQLDKLQWFKERRQRMRQMYNEAFGNLDGVIVQQELPGSDTCPHLYILRLDRKRLKINRKEFFEAMAAENIICNVHYIPVYYFPFYQKMGYRKGLCPQAEALYEDMLTLPLHACMEDEDCRDVIHAVEKLVKYYHR